MYADSQTRERDSIYTLLEIAYEGWIDLTARTVKKNDNDSDWPTLFLKQQASSRRWLSHIKFQQGAKRTSFRNEPPFWGISGMQTSSERILGSDIWTLKRRVAMRSMNPRMASSISGNR